MKQLFLTSTIDIVAQDVAQHLDLQTCNDLVFINTAAEVETGDKEWLNDDRQALVNVGFKVTDYTITGKASSQLESELRDYDYIYLSGGNTFYLLEQSHKSGFTIIIQNLINKQGKTYIGTSAGSIIAGPKLPEYLVSLDDPAESGLVDTKAFGFVNFTILPHWGSENFRKRYLESRLESAYKSDQVPLLLLTNTQYVHVTGDDCKIIDINHNSL